MSEPHDHDHDHDHPHGEGHKHSPVGTGGTGGAGDPLVPARRTAAAPPPPPPEPVEDSGSQALSDALRSSFVIVKILMVLLVFVFLGSGVFTVPPQEKAIRLHFGRPVGSGDRQFLGPGLHWSYPYPIDEIVRIPVSEIQTVASTVGWYATTPELEAANSEPPPGASLNPATDGYTITADGNIIHVRAWLRYQISNPVNYALNFVNASNVVQNALNNALIYSSLHFKVEDALRLDVVGFRDMVNSRVRQLVDQQAFGITIVQVDLEPRPPRQVKDIFDRYTAADLDRRKAINEAEAKANVTLSAAQGEAASIINAGETDKTRMIQAVAAEAQSFQDQLQQFKENPSLFMQRRSAEAMSRILTNTQDKYFLPRKTDGKPYELRLQLSREPQKPNQAAPGGNP